MLKTKMFGVGAAMALVAACGQPVPDALVGIPKVPMPSFAYSFIGCMVWSCASGQCQNDPTVWGACCTSVSPDPEEPGFDRPSCGSGPTYCETYPARCNADLGANPGLAADFCFHANVGGPNYEFPPETSICGDEDYESNSAFPLRCAGQGTIDEFPECFPQSGVN
jgi:hypothetical protein